MVKNSLLHRIIKRDSKIRRFFVFVWKVVIILGIAFGFFMGVQWIWRSLSGSMDISIDSKFENNVNGTPALRFNLINHYRKDLHGVYATATLTCENNYTEVLSAQQLDSGYSGMVRDSDKDIITSQSDRYSSLVNINNDCADAYFTLAEYLNLEDDSRSVLGNITVYSFYKTEDGFFITSTNYSMFDWIGVKTCLPCEITLKIYSEEKDFTKVFKKNFFTNDIVYTPFPENSAYSPTGKAYFGIAQASLDYGICKGKTSEDCEVMLCNYINDKTSYNVDCHSECMVGKFDYTPFEYDLVYSLNSKTYVYNYTFSDGKTSTIYHTKTTACSGL